MDDETREKLARTRTMLGHTTVDETARIYTTPADDADDEDE